MGGVHVFCCLCVCVQGFFRLNVGAFFSYLNRLLGYVVVEPQRGSILWQGLKSKAHVEKIRVLRFQAFWGLGFRVEGLGSSGSVGSVAEVFDRLPKFLGSGISLDALSFCFGASVNKYKLQRRPFSWLLPKNLT